MGGLYNMQNKMLNIGLHALVYMPWTTCPGTLCIIIRDRPMSIDYEFSLINLYQDSPELCMGQRRLVWLYVSEGDP